MPQAKKKPVAPRWSELTDAQRKEFRSALNATWQAIGSDVLQCAEQDSIPRDEVIEVTLDADYILMYGNLKDPVLKTFYRYGSFEDKMQAGAETFTCERYGW